MSDQSDLSAEIARNTREINRQLERQLRYTLLINEAERTSADDLASRLEGNSQLRRQLNQIESAAGGASRGMSDFGTTGTDGASRTNSELVKTHGMLGQIQAAANNLDQGLMAMYGDFYDLQRSQQLAFGGALNQADESENFVRTRLNRLYADSYRAQYDYIEGANVSIVELYGSWENFYRDVASIFDSDYRMAAELAESTNTFTQENMMELGAYQRALGYNAQETAAIMNRTITDHGEVNLELMESIAFYSKRADRIFGANMKAVSKDMATMMTDVNRFGGLTEGQMASFSVVANQLRLDIGQLANVAQGFESFDQAASKVGNLTSVFGVQLDAMDLMMKSSTDMTGFITDIRDSFMEAGHSADNLNIFQQRLIAQNLGLKVEEVRRLLSPDFDVSEWEEIEEAMSVDPADAIESALESVSGDMQRAQIDAGDLANVIATNLVKAVGIDSVQAFTEARGAISDFGGAITTLASSGGTQTLEALGVVLEDLLGGDPDQLRAMGAGFVDFGTDMANAMQLLTEGELEAAGEVMVEAFGNIIPESARLGIDQADFGPMWQTFVQRLREAGLAVEAIPQSPVPMWVKWGRAGSESYFYGMEEDLPSRARRSMVNVTSSIESEFGPASVAMARRINTLLGQEGADALSTQLATSMNFADGDMEAARRNLETRLGNLERTRGHIIGEAGQTSEEFREELDRLQEADQAALMSSLEEASRERSESRPEIDVDAMQEQGRADLDAHAAAIEAQNDSLEAAVEIYGDRWTSVMEKFDEVQYDRTTQLEGDTEMFLETLENSQSALSQITGELREQNISYADLQGTAEELEMIQQLGLRNTTELAFAMDAQARRQADRIEGQAEFAEAELTFLRDQGYTWETLDEEQRNRLTQGSGMSAQSIIASLNADTADVGTALIDDMRDREMRRAVRESQRGTAEGATTPAVEVDTEVIETRLAELVDIMRQQRESERATAAGSTGGLASQVAALRTAVQEVRDAVGMIPPVINGTVVFDGEKYGNFLIRERGFVANPGIPGVQEGDAGATPTVQSGAPPGQPEGADPSE